MKRTVTRGVRVTPILVPVLMAVFLVGAWCLPVTARGSNPFQEAAPDWSKGALSGRVLDTATGKPVPGATVALENKDGKVVAWTKTNPQGEYKMAADSLHVLQLRPSRHRGFLEKVAHGVGKVVTAPVKVVASAVKAVDPVATGKAAVVSAATANPAAISAQAAATVGKAVADQTTAKAKEQVTKAVLGERQATPKEKRKTLVPGEVFLSVAAPGYKTLKDKVGAYWLDPAANTPDGKTTMGVCAHLETVKLAPAAAADTKSEVENSAVLLSDGRVEPALAAAGTTVKLSVQLATPGNQPLKIRIFAREDKKHTVVELLPQEGTPGRFTAELPLAKDIDPGDTIITLVALRAEPIEVDLKESKADPLLHFAKDLDDLEAGHDYEFDPRIMASENRLDLPLTILDPKGKT